ncbi:MAG TPA: type II toxin-antitoxin system RelB/DinJ family antitoxin [Candidatus Faecousia intestinigallinarum]|nr:type II toxin-antitoxin system RelB/DinJ family antitoxin [Candidatus Faecousia intestinigallinarum]
MDTNLNVGNAPKTSLFQFRINPEIKSRLEAIYAKNGLTLTDAINIFLQQSINADGLPFLVSPENKAFMRRKAAKILMAELQNGIDSGEAHGWISEEEADRILGVSAE